MFGADQDVGAFRSQKLDSLGGKILRITPDLGEGVCSDSTSFYDAAIVKNPYCDFTQGKSRPSKVWTFGTRNPFRMAKQPYLGIGPVPMPGVFFFGDVGQGGYEEINKVSGPSM